MDEMQLLGTVLTSLISIGGFVLVIMKFIQPINELRIVIQKLNDSIDGVTKDNNKQDVRLDKHSTKIDGLDCRVGILETKVNIHTGD